MTVYESKEKKRRNLWREVINDTKGASGDEAVKYRLALLDRFRQPDGHWAYLTARDWPTEEYPEGKPIIWTVDERDDSIPVKPFPEEKEYLREITYELWRHRFVFIDKARQMLMTTLSALNIDWFCSYRTEREVFVSRIKEESAIKLINDKIRVVHTRKPLWLQEACPMNTRPANMITYLETGSTVTGVSQNFAVSDARGPTGSLIDVDEAAYQEFFGQIWTAVLPMTARLWAITTANIGNPGAKAFITLAREGRPGEEARS